ncbi:diguanylate cyclase domain-containing protein [Virgibacillus sp. JSM 102003]|uniref:diguanylate cyclase domain-containing protein n=1 Tax=Virgibacillus sp. JSM 102003 TaxID=1562108 RepID=UPI0035C2061E
MHNVHPDDRKQLEGIFIQSINSGESFTVEIRQYNYQNETVWSQSHGTPVFDNQNNFIHMLVLTRDISLQKAHELKLEDFAHHDPLTGLPNRRLFNVRIEQRLEEFKDHNALLAVIMLDIDHFKEINDSMGHDVGDRVIKEFGNRLRETVRDEDLVARLGGDEFVILLPGIESAENAVAIAESIQNAIRQPWKANDSTISITSSMGIAMSEQDITPSSMLKNADIALYEVKNKGRNAYKLFE